MCLNTLEGAVQNVSLQKSLFGANRVASSVIATTTSRHARTVVYFAHSHSDLLQVDLLSVIFLAFDGMLFWKVV